MRNLKQKKQLTIHFMDKSKITFDFPVQSDEYIVNQKIKNLLHDQYIMIEADGSLCLYPLQNIKSMQVYPSPISESLQNTIQYANVSNFS